MLVVVIEGCLQAIVQDIQVYTIVLLERLFPCHIRIVLSRLVCTRSKITTVYTEVVTFAKSVWVVGIHETRTTNLVVTDKTPRCTKLEIVHHFAQRLEKRLLADNPSYRTSREETISIVLGKVLGAIVAHIELSHIAVVPVVGDTTYQTNIS